MKDKKTIIVLISIIVVATIATVGLTAVNTKMEKQEYESEYSKYEKDYKEEDKRLFETTNKNYKDETAENSKQIILEFDEKNSKEVNLAIVNYLSNVNGRLVSVNGKTVAKDTINPITGLVYGGNGIIYGTIFADETEESKNIYIIQVPQDAKYADNLQERMDEYMKYKTNN